MVYDLKSGGFALHQILGWHHLICSIDTCQAETVAALKPQNYQDGLFQRSTWMRPPLALTCFWCDTRFRPSLIGQASLPLDAERLRIFQFFRGPDRSSYSRHSSRAAGHPQRLLFVATGVLLLIVGLILSKHVQRDAADLPPPRTPTTR